MNMMGNTRKILGNARNTLGNTRKMLGNTKKLDGVGPVDNLGDWVHLQFTPLNLMRKCLPGKSMISNQQKKGTDVFLKTYFIIRLTEIYRIY